MAVTYSIDETARLVVLRYEGMTSFADFAATMRDVFTDSRFGPGFAILADRSNVEPPTVTYIRQVSEFMRSYRAELTGTRWATVVASPVGFGMARIGQAINDDMPVKLEIFTTVDEALKWLRRGSPGEVS